MVLLSKTIGLSLSAHQRIQAIQSKTNYFFHLSIFSAMGASSSSPNADDNERPRKKRLYSMQPKQRKPKSASPFSRQGTI